MTKHLLFALLVSAALPCLSHNSLEASKRGRENRSPILKHFTPEDQLQKIGKNFSFWEAGHVSLKNNAVADSILVHINDPEKAYWQLYLKEFPVYYEGTFLIREMESWYIDDSGNFLPEEKKVIHYNEQEVITRMDTYIWENQQWTPAWAEEKILNELGEEIFYASYYHDSSSWVMTDGDRATDEFEGQMLVSRLWEYYNPEYRAWTPYYLDEYIYNENNLNTGITGYWYDDWEQTWEEDFREEYEYGENGTWVSGYTYEWDMDEEQWVPELKLTDLQWYDFELRKIAEATVHANAENQDDWKGNISDGTQEVIWIPFMHLLGEYTQDGLPTALTVETWDFDSNSWAPFFRFENQYDHFNNIILEVFSLFFGEWIVMGGYKLEMEYHEDLSIKQFDVLYSSEDWNKEFLPVMRSQYFYPQDPTSTPIIDTPAQISAYPNPAFDHINLSLPSEGSVEIIIMSTDGRVIRQLNHLSQPGLPMMIDISGLKPGLYFIIGQGRDGKHLTRFIKQ